MDRNPLTVLGRDVIGEETCARGNRQAGRTGAIPMEWHFSALMIDCFSARQRYLALRGSNHESQTR